jgi:hypothetical protein
MTPKKKALSLVDTYRIVLMNEDTQCGEEILCTEIAKRCALIAVNEIRRLMNRLQNYEEAIYWNEVKNEIEKL